MRLISRSEARQQNLKRFFTGLPCKRGHIAERFVLGGCVVCLNDDSLSRYHADPAKGKAMTYKWRAANPEGTKRILLKSRHKARKYPEPTRPKTATCEICSREPSAKKSLALDHCHATGRFRGWLCDRCNLALGLFNDKTDLLFKAIKYLTSETICVN